MGEKMNENKDKTQGYQEYNIVFLLGATGSGKDYFLKKLLEHDFTKVVSATSRYQRTDECNGEDYFFNMENYPNIAYIGKGEFGDKFYGIPDFELNYLCYHRKNMVIIIDPDGLENVLDWFERGIINNRIPRPKRIDVVLLNIPRTTRFNNILREYSALYGEKDGLEKTLERICRNQDNFEERVFETDLKENLLSWAKGSKDYLKKEYMFLDTLDGDIIMDFIIKNYPETVRLPENSLPKVTKSPKKNNPVQRKTKK